MATNYGTGLRALLGLSPKGDLVTGKALLLQRMVHRLTTPTDGYADCGDPAPYLSLDLRRLIGSRPSEADLRDAERLASAALREEERVDSATCALRFDRGRLTATVKGAGAGGPFGFVAAVTEIDVEILESY